MCEWDIYICCSVVVTTSVLIHILGMSSSCCLMCVHWLQLYDNPQPERRGEAFPAEWSRSSRCFCASASETKLLQGSVCCKLEQLTCMLYSSKETNQWCPSSKHFYLKCQRKYPKCCNMWRHLIQPLYHHGRLWWIKTQASQSHGSYMQVYAHS